MPKAESTRKNTGKRGGPSTNLSEVQKYLISRNYVSKRVKALDLFSTKGRSRA